MDKQGKIFVIEPPSRDYISRGIVAQLSQDGYHVCQYADVEAVQRAGDDLARADVIVTLRCSAEMMARAPRLRAIINPYTGSEHIDRAAATARNIVIGNGQTSENYICMAEATILLLLNCFYDLARTERVLRDNLPRPPVTARMLAGKTIGIIGYGQIGQAVAQRLEGWNVRQLISAPRLHAALPNRGEHVSLETLLAQSDAVLVLCSLNDQTRNLLNRDRIGLLKPGACVVNTSRGGIIDEQALNEAAVKGRLGRLALDAFATEPLPPDSELRNLPNATLTPHMIGHTIEAEATLRQTAAESARRVLAGRPPVYVFNPEVLDQWRPRYGEAARQE